MTAATLLCLTLGAASAGAPHGGTLAATGNGQLELVVGSAERSGVAPGRIALFPLDAQLRPAPLGGAEAFLIGANGVTLPLAAAGDHWEAANPYGTQGSLTLVAVVREAAGSRAARFELRSGEASLLHEHRPFHGGQVGMAGERHLELARVATATGEELQLYLTNAYRQPDSLEGVHGTLTVQEKGQSFVLPLVPSGDCFTAQAPKPAGPENVHVHLVYPTAPTEVEMDYYLDEASAAEPAAKSAQIRVGGNGFSPGRVEARAGKPLTLRFLRTTDDTCAKEVVFPSLGVRKSLPLGQEVDIALVPTSGETRFTCGMGMVKGSVFAN